MRAGPLTLGELLFADPAITRIAEKDWLALVRAMASGDEIALRVLFEKSYPVVSSYLIRVTGDRRMAEEVILDVFEDLWCEAPIFDSTNGPVLGWIMRQARSSALVHASRTQPLQHESERIAPDLQNDSTRVDVGSGRPPEDVRLQVALAALTLDEHQSIEAAFLHGLSYAEVAAQRGESTGTVRNRIRSGLSKLRRSLQERGGES